MNHCSHVFTYYAHRAAGNLCEDGLLAASYEMLMHGGALYFQQVGRAFRKPVGKVLVLDFDTATERKKPL